MMRYELRWQTADGQTVRQESDHATWLAAKAEGTRVAAMNGWTFTYLARARVARAA
jgi:hypothetical protein